MNRILSHVASTARTSAGRRISSCSGARRVDLGALAAVIALLTATMPLGSASATDPACGPVVDGAHQVATAAQLREVGSGGAGTGDCGLGADYQQVAAIDLTGGADFDPIGTFTGTYDGGGFPITGLSITTAGEFDRAGMFSYVDGATLEDIVLVDVSVSAGSRSGALVGWLESGTIRRSSASGTVDVGDQEAPFAGGLVGIMRDGTSVTHARADVTVTGTYGGGSGTYVGGLVGQLASGTVSDSYARGSVSLGKTGYVAGLIGSVVDIGTDPVVTNVYATGLVEDTGGSPGWGLIGVTAAELTLTGAFWDEQTSGTDREATDATGATTVEMTTFGTFDDAGWDIVDGWESSDPSAGRVWGICSAVNDGYPFLLWEYDSDPCTVEASSEGAVASPSVSCGPLPATVGATLTCSVTGGDPGIDILWRAAFNPVFAEAGVTLDSSGAGEFSFTVPAGAVGEVLTVELVEWAAPVSLGVVGGPVPSSVPSGGGPVSVWPFVLVALVGVGLLRRGMRAQA